MIPLGLFLAFDWLETNFAYFFFSEFLQGMVDEPWLQLQRSHSNMESQNSQ